MPFTFTPLADYADTHHVLGAGCCFCHPKNGNLYFWDCVQIDGPRQNLTIYRIVAKTGAWETVVRFQGGGADSERGIERGGCVIGQGGALHVATTLIPIDVPYVTETGFQGVRCRIPGIDEPWGMGIEPVPDPALAAAVAQLQHTVALQQQQITEMETALDNAGKGGLSAADADVINWARALRAVIGMA